MDAPCVYATLLTKTSYLAGVLVLSHTLRSAGSRHPLVVMVTPTLPQDARNILTKSGIAMREVEPLQPTSTSGTQLFEDRFADTWTKLRLVMTVALGFPSLPLTCPGRAFELFEFRVKEVHFTKAVFLADSAA